MKAIHKFFITIAVIITLIVGAVVGGYFYVKQSYGIDLIKTASELITLSKPVEEQTLCKNAWKTEDVQSAQTEINNSVENYVTFTEQGGYSVNFSALPTEMKRLIKLNDKQVGALAHVILQQEMKGEIEIGGRVIKGDIIQIDFSDVKDGGALVSTTYKVDVSSIKEQMTGFPFNLIQNLVPTNFYVTSTVRVTKGEPFEYTVTHSALSINYLSGEETEDLFNTLNVVLKLGTAKEFNEILGNKLIGTLVGGETQKGVATSLKPIGAKDYEFIVENGVEYYTITL